MILRRSILHENFIQVSVLPVDEHRTPAAPTGALAQALYGGPYNFW